MEVSSTNKDEEVPKLNVDIDETIIKDDKIDCSETEKDQTLTDENSQPNKATIDYDEAEDSGDDFAVITETSSGNYTNPAKNMFSIKTAPNLQMTNTYKISKTAIDLEHPGNINGVPTVDYEINKLPDDCKPWKKPGADVSDFFNYGFTEETWLIYCEKQKSNRLIQDSSSLKQLSGFTNLPYNLSGSHINLGFNRNNTKMSNDGLIDVIGSQPNSDFKNKHNDGNIVNKISTIPVQTGHMNINLNQPGNYMSGFTSHALNNNLLNPLMSALALGMLPNPGNVSFLNNGLMDPKIAQFQPMDSGPRNYGPSNTNNNWNNNQNYERHNSADRLHVNEDYKDRKSSYIRPDRSSRRNDYEESHQYRSHEKREKSTEKHHRSRSTSRGRGHDSKHSRSSKRKRSSDDGHRHSRHSRDRSKDRASSDDSYKGHKHRKSSKNRRQTKSRSRDSDRKRRQKVKSPAAVTGRSGDSDKHKQSKNDVVPQSDKIVANVKREKEASNCDRDNTL